MTILLPYPAYKTSGVEWLGNVPGHWALRRLKTVAILKAGEGITSEEIDAHGNFPVYGGNGLRGYSDRFTHEGHFALIGRQGALCGNIHYVEGRFWASEHAIVATPIPGIEPQWLSRVLRAMTLGQYSVSAAQPGIGVESIRDLEVPFPPLDEQRAIADFLDGMDARITRFIAARRKMIALLEEKKQATINQAVTRGLDPDVPMKDSGVDWLGAIPAHWEFRRLSHLVRSIEQGWSPNASNDASTDDDRWWVVSLSSVKDGQFDQNARKPLGADVEPDPRLRLSVGDFLMTRANTRQLVGDAAIVEDSPGKLIMSDLIYRLNLRIEVTFPHYLLQVLLSPIGRYQIERDARASNESMVKLNHRAIRSWILPLPPICEQRTIFAHIDHETSRIDTLISHHRREIDLMQEYRTRLISDVVTGKLDVRGVELPAVEEVIGKEIEAAMEDEQSNIELAMSGESV